MNEHRFHSCNDESCYPCRGGLALCVICGGAEGALPKDCPGVRMTPEQNDAIYAGTLDFMNGVWITPVKKQRGVEAKA